MTDDSDKELRDRAESLGYDLECKWDDVDFDYCSFRLQSSKRDPNDLTISGIKGIIAFLDMVERIDCPEYKEASND